MRPETGGLAAPISGASIVRRGGRAGVASAGILARGCLGGVANPIPFQLNVPTYCIFC